MKFFVISALGLIAATNSLKCQNGSVPDANSICISPKYIEGCFSYAT